MGRMTGIDAKDGAYSRWNTALAQAYFVEDNAGKLVYLDKDDEAFVAAATSLGTAVDEAPAALAAAVRERLHWKRSGTPIFTWFDYETEQWLARRNRSDGKPTEPPHIALLTVFSIAAETMGNMSGGRQSGNEAGFYAQLENLLSIPAEESLRLRSAFRASTEAYWEALALWLEEHDGALGLPSAYALTHRYVGLPVSQALVRETERRNLRRMFEEQGLLPGSVLSHSEMFGALDVWIRSARTSANAAMIKMWGNSDTRDRITDIAVAELAAWDGPGNDGIGETHNAHAKRCFITLREKRKGLGTVFQLGLLVNLQVASEEEAILTGENNDIPVVLRHNSPGRAGVDFGPAVPEYASFLEGLVSITTASGLTIRRFPKNVLILSRDPVTERYMETDRIMPGTPARILVRLESGLADAVERIIIDSAQPGYVRHPENSAGIPQGWIIFDRVQIVRSPAAALTASKELAGFELRLSSQMTLTGGLKLPGRIARWSSLSPLQLVITSEDEGHFDLVATTLKDESLQAQEIVLKSAIRAPYAVMVADLDIDREDFTLSLRAGKRTLQSLAVKLRDSTSTRLLAAEPFRYLCRDFMNPMWPITAVPNNAAEHIGIDGLLIDGDVRQAREVPYLKAGTWKERRVERPRGTLVRLAPPGPTSCLVTGRHRFVFPTFHGGWPQTNWMYGECEQCHLSHRAPTRPKQRVQRTTPSSQVQLPPLLDTETNWEALMDALAYIGSGTIKEFSVLARQLEDTAFFEKYLISSLEALAFIEVERNESHLITHWEVAASSIGGLSDGSWMLAGLWGKDMQAHAAEAVKNAGGRMDVLNGQTHASKIIMDMTASEVEQLAADLDVVFQPNAAEALAAVLPEISTLDGSLTRALLPSMQGCQFFEPASATWIDVESAEYPGLFRTRDGYLTQYIYRNQQDVEDGVGAKVTVELGKHLSAVQYGRHLVAYDPDSRMLSVPMGADLPGIYGRAAVMASGCLPTADYRTSSLNYRGVELQTARLLIGKVAS